MAGRFFFRTLQCFSAARPSEDPVCVFKTICHGYGTPPFAKTSDSKLQKSLRDVPTNIQRR